MADQKHSVDEFEMPVIPRRTVDEGIQTLGESGNAGTLCYFKPKPPHQEKPEMLLSLMPQETDL